MSASAVASVLADGARIRCSAARSSPGAGVVVTVVGIRQHRAPAGSPSVHRARYRGPMTNNGNNTRTFCRSRATRCQTEWISDYKGHDRLCGGEGHDREGDATYPQGDCSTPLRTGSWRRRAER
jgi:hypothetical protein